MAVLADSHGGVAACRVLFVVGASGVGKTTAVAELQRRGMSCFFFDSIGLPSPEEMVREFGSGEAWQLDATKRWLRRLSAERSTEPVVLEGQTRPSFIRAALAGSRNLNVAMVLLECRPDVRSARLAARGQRELDSEQMRMWAVYLRGQADALGMPVIDTSDLSVERVADELVMELNAF